MVLPVIHLRQDSDLSNLESGTTSMDYLFDKERFLSRIGMACPQMRVYQDLEELESMGTVTKTELIDPKKLPHAMTSRIAYSCREHIKEIRAPPGEISLIPLENLWRHLYVAKNTISSHARLTLTSQPDMPRLCWLRRHIRQSDTPPTGRPPTRCHRSLRIILSV